MQKPIENAAEKRGQGMARDSLTGTRIRDRRSVAGIRQADLARQIGISASSLNLNEHIRLRIGGKLLTRVAEVLETAPEMLSAGAEGALPLRGEQ